MDHDFFFVFLIKCLIIFTGFEIYISGLKHVERPDEEIKNHFQKYGKIVDSHFPRIEKKRKGYGFITFEHEEPMKKLIKKGQIFVERKKLDIKPVHEKKMKNQPKKKFTKNVKKDVKQKKKKIQVPCKFGDSCKFLPNCRFLHQKNPKYSAAAAKNPSATTTTAQNPPPTTTAAPPTTAPPPSCCSHSGYFYPPPPPHHHHGRCHY